MKEVNFFLNLKFVNKKFLKRNILLDFREKIFLWLKELITQKNEIGLKKKRKILKG